MVVGNVVRQLAVNASDPDAFNKEAVQTSNVRYHKAAFSSMLSFSFFAACLMEAPSDAPYLLGDNILLGLLAGSSLLACLSGAFTANAARYPSKALSHERINETKYGFAIAALGLFASVMYACVEGEPHGWKEFVGFSGIYATVGAIGVLAAHSSYALFRDNRPKI